MNEHIPVFLRIASDDSVHFKGTGTFTLIIPEQFFERNHAIVEGEITHVIGILNYYVLKPGEKFTEKKVKRFNFPSVFSTKPGNIEKVKSMKIRSSDKPSDYRLYTYEDNAEDQIICNLNYPMELGNAEEFMSIFINTGKIPSGIKYHDLYEYFERAMNLNGESFGMTMQEFGLLVSEFCRDPHDISKPFRLSADLDKDPYNYDVVSIKELAKLVSPFTSIVTENWNEAIVNGSLIDDKDIISTPMERIMTGED